MSRHGWIDRALSDTLLRWTLAEAAVIAAFVPWSGWIVGRRHGLPGAVVFLDPLSVILWLLAGVWVMRRFTSLLLAVATSAIGLFALVGQFASIYLAYGSTRDWSEELTRTDALLVALGTLTTAGTGGISPISQTARGWMAAQMAIDIVATIVIFGLLATRLAERRHRPIKVQADR